jgi:hypothetical protein
MSVTNYCLFTHMKLDYEFVSESYMSMKMLPASHPLVKYLTKKRVSKIDLGKTHNSPVLDNCSKECSILYQKIMQYLWNTLSPFTTIEDTIGQPMKIVKIVECQTFFMDEGDEEWSEDELETAISGDDLEELRYIVDCLEAEDPHLEVDAYQLKRLQLTTSDLDNPQALLELIQLAPNTLVKRN